MVVIKFFERPDIPQYAIAVRTGPLGLLINYPLDKPERKREARWIDLDRVHVEWVRNINLGE